MVIAKRARSNEQKGERREEILVAAEAFLEKKSFHRIGIADIAAQAGMAKGTVFLYFKTKEELFLAIAAREFEQWFDEMDRSFAEIAGSPEKVARNRVLSALGEMLKPDAHLINLIPIVHTVLEQNIRYPQAREFKRMLGRRLPHTGALLEGCLPFLCPGQGVTFLLWMYALVIGFLHLATPAPVIKKVFQKEPALRMMQIDFGASYPDALGAILDGWKAQNRGRKK
jgi:AcrR family transcriptional regulator